MIIHTDGDNPKPIELKVRELFLNKLYVKADDIDIYIDLADFLKLVFRDIRALAAAEYNVARALKDVLRQPHDLEINPTIKKIELEEYADKFSIEIDAYRLYLDLKIKGAEDLDIYDQVRFALNEDDELLEKRLYALMMDSVGLKISEENAIAMGANRQLLLETYANYIKVLASNDSIDDAAEELYFKNEDFFRQNNLKIDFMKGQLEQFAPALQDETKAYKFALNLYNIQGADIAMILATVKQLLQLN